MPYSRKFSSRRKTCKKRAYKRKSYAPKRKAAPLKAIIRREIARNIENKNSQLFVTDNRLYVPGGASFPTNNVIPVGIDPTAIWITQGTGQGQRIGNRIKTKKLVFKGTLNPLPYDGTFNPVPQPVQLKMWIFYDKSTPTDFPDPVGNGDFFQNGTSSATFANDLIDMWRPVNSDRYRVLASKVFKLGYSYYAGSNGALPNSGNQSNNDFKLNCNFSFDLTKHYPKHVVFQDGSSVPTTRGLFCMFQYVYATGGAVPTTNYSVGSQWMLDYHYEDA